MILALGTPNKSLQRTRVAPATPPPTTRSADLRRQAHKGQQMKLEGLKLAFPDKPDVERNAVAGAWSAAGGSVFRLGRFGIRPNLIHRRYAYIGPILSASFSHSSFASSSLALGTISRFIWSAVGPAARLKPPNLSDAHGPAAENKR
jgi:hypothetical protein